MRNPRVSLLGIAVEGAHLKTMCLSVQEEVIAEEAFLRRVDGW